jgi:hypothetical protein
MTLKGKKLYPKDIHGIRGFAMTYKGLVTFTMTYKELTKKKLCHVEFAPIGP